MTPPDRQEISFLDDDGRELRPDEVGDDVAADRASRRQARVEQWLPDGGSAAIASLVFVLVAWIGAQPLVAAVTALAPDGRHRIGPITEQSITFGDTGYSGVTPGLIPVISYGTRALLVVIALVLAARARRRERSVLAGAALTTSSVSLLLFVLAAVVMAIGFAMGHGTGVYGIPI